MSWSSESREGTYSRFARGGLLPRVSRDGDVTNTDGCSLIMARSAGKANFPDFYPYISRKRDADVVTLERPREVWIVSEKARTFVGWKCSHETIMSV